MEKYIGFNIDSKKTVTCVLQRGKKQIHNLQKGHSDIEQPLSSHHIQLFCCL